MNKYNMDCNECYKEYCNQCATIKSLICAGILEEVKGHFRKRKHGKRKSVWVKSYVRKVC